jgi:hypothetical protein
MTIVTDCIHGYPVSECVTCSPADKGSYDWYGQDYTADGQPVGGKYDELYLDALNLHLLPEPEPLIEDVLDGASVFAVRGRDGVYKSFFVLSWLCSLASGRPWLNHTTRRTKTLYVVGEGVYGLASRVAAWQTAWGHNLDPGWLHIRREPINLFKQAEAFADLLERIEREQYGVVIFDTLQRMSAGADTNHARDASVIIGGLDSIRKRLDGGSVGVVAHSGKSDVDIRGSSAFEDDVDLVWHLKRDDDSEQIFAEMTKRKDGPLPRPLELRPRTVEGTGSLVLESARGLPPSTEPRGSVTVLKILAGSAVPAEGLGATAIKNGLGLAGNSSVHNILSWLMDKQYVQMVQVGRWPTYKITEVGMSRLITMQEAPL